MRLVQTTKYLYAHNSADIMRYDLELRRAAELARKAKLVCIQLPDGLKPKAKEIQDYIEKHSKAAVIIWAGSCYGACDCPDLEKLGVDLLIQWGHSEWHR
jgi:diphthamide biosynthesis enzyme Dph1/Dph2-like protein